MFITHTQKQMHIYSYTQVGGGMDGLFLSHANAYSLTYPNVYYPYTSTDAYTDIHRLVEEWMDCSYHMPMPILSHTLASTGR